MIYQLHKIVQDVRVCLDQNDIDTPLTLSGDPNTLMLDDLIKSNIVKAVNKVHELAPYHMLEQGHTFRHEADDIYWQELESGWVLLPLNFLRLVVFKMSDWERPVYVPISPTDKRYKQLRCRVKSLRGTAQRPVCAVVQRPEGLALEFYSCKSTDATVTQAVYVPYARIDRDGGVDISKRCYDAAVDMTAGLTLLAMADKERATLLMKTAEEMLV